MTDPYTVIGVPQDADLDTVKQAYKKLVMKWHPDRNQDNPEAQTKIREINAAYDAIKNDKAEPQYKDPFAGARSYTQEADLNDILKNFEHMFGSGFSSDFNRRTVRNVQVQYGMTLEEAFHGKEAEITFRTPDSKTKTVRVRIPAGTNNGDTLRCPGQGYSHGGGPVSDLMIIVHVLPHAQFERRGPNLVTAIQVDAFDAMTGTSEKIHTIDGTVIEVNIPAGTQPNTIMQARGHGMPYHNNRGDLMIQVKVTTPVLNQEQIEKLKEFKNQL